MKKLLFGIAWFVVFYISLLLLVGIIHLFLGEGQTSFQEGYEVGLTRGAEFVESGGRILIIMISAILSGILSYKGILPGTKEKRFDK
jgi:hypothetical protein